MSTVENTDLLDERVKAQLQEELVIWLTTTSADGTPQPNPVWFLPDGDDIVVYSHRTAARNRNIQRSNRVSLNFNSDCQADHMTVLTGIAEFESSYPPANENQAYLDKYGHLIPGLDMTPDTYADTFSVVLRIRPKKVRGW
jgi:PPOX class probable F420-dependent enzyme